ncbi:MAG: hypothetical protein P4N24_05950, partial [Acidobacteriota bacterium]|nr:hypothetical protein [Acidobacteriota bacterium]
MSPVTGYSSLLLKVRQPMGSPSPASSSKTKETSSKTSKGSLLDSRRLYELMGLLTSVAGLLILLS